MNHPLFLDVKSLSHEELEHRQTEILKRMQKLRQWNQTQGEAWSQLALMLDTIELEKQERFLTFDRDQSDTPTSVVVNTDPLPDDEDQIQKPKPKPRQYTVL